MGLAYLWPIVAKPDAVVILLALGLAVLVSTALLSFAPRRTGWLLAAALATGGQVSTACLLAPASGPGRPTLVAASFGLCFLGAWIGRDRTKGSGRRLVQVLTALVTTALIGSTAYLTPEALNRRAAWHEDSARDLPAPSSSAPRFAKRPDVFLLAFCRPSPTRSQKTTLG